MCYSIYINLFLLDTILIAASNECEENNIGLSVQGDTLKHFYVSLSPKAQGKGNRQIT